MKKWLISAAAVTTGLCVLSWPVHADDYHPQPADGSEWNVTFNEAGTTLVSNFTTDSVQDVVNEMQPGDDVYFEINLVNSYKTPVDWYLKNEVTDTFEAIEQASGGAYSYTLTYTSPSGADQTLYTSDTVGGELDESAVKPDEEGLEEATNALKDEWLYLDRIATNGKAQVVIHVGLDGETQINGYQDTAGALNAQFAVEIPETEPGKPDVIKPSSGRGRRIIYVPNTSDPFKALPYMICGLLSLILFALSAYLLWRTREEK